MTRFRAAAWPACSGLARARRRREIPRVKTTAARLLTVPFLALTALLSAQEPPAGEKPADDKSGTPGRAGALWQFPKEYRQLVDQAMESFLVRDFKGALANVDKADQVLPPTVWTLNVRGAVAIEQRNFAEGVKYCEAALKLDGAFFPAKFNLSEVLFLQGKYAEARALWLRLLQSYPLHRAPGRADTTAELLLYRIFLTFLLEKDTKNAREWLEKIPYPSSTPAYPYAHAAWEHELGRMEKWEEWLKQTENIWPASERASFSDLLMQLGWIKRPTGEDGPVKK